jgi:hypothetical protein
MLKMKAMVGIVLFAGLFIAAFYLNEQLNRYNNVLHEPSTDIQILEKNGTDKAVPSSLNVLDPFKPREYIRIRQRFNEEPENEEELEGLKNDVEKINSD